MANVLTDLAADLYKSADRVSREQVGFIPSVIINGDGSERAAIGDKVRSHFTRSVSLVDRTVAMTIAEGADQTVDNKYITITNDKAVNIPWTGEDIRSVNNGSGFETIYGDQVMQAMRAIANQMETDLFNEAWTNASRAYGTAGTTPFATAGNFTDASEVLRILKDNGAGTEDNSLIINTAAGAKFIGLQSRADIAGGTEMQRQGVLLNLNGLALRESAAVAAKGSNVITGDVTVTGVNAVGATTINLTTASGAAVEAVAGDIITLAGDANKYVVAAPVTIGASTTGNIVLAEPGLRIATTATQVVSGVAAATRNIAFRRSAIELVARAPSVPVIGGVARDAAVDRMTVVDQRSGMPYEVSVYLGQGKAMIQVAAAWGVKAWKREHIATLLG